MTDPDDLSSGGRIDLSALDVARDYRREEAVVQKVMHRIARTSSETDIISIARFQRGMAAAAAVLLMLASALVLATDRPPPDDDVADMMMGWVESGHVPTNGELLATYGGYRP